MKLIMIIFTFLLWQDSNAQIDNITIHKTINKYTIDNQIITQLLYEFVNNSTDNYILWIEKDTINSLSTDLKIKKYFNTLKGDFTLSDMIYENEIIRQGSSTLFFSFYKIIKPKDKFYLTIIKKAEISKPIEFQKDIEKHIVIVRENESKRLPDIKSLEILDYQGSNITIFSEFLNL